jgi:NitT/TauT family transport system substrate-binding protein
MGGNFMRRRRVLAVGLAVIAIASVGLWSTTAVATTGSQKSPTTIKLGSLKIANSAPQVIDPTLFSDRGVKLDISYATSGAAIVPGVIGGSFDVGYGSTVSVVQAIQQGLPIRVIANGDISVGDVVVEDGSEIENAKDLEGKKVATNALKSTVDLQVSASVDQDHGDASKVTFVEVPFPAQLAALDAGTIDAAVLPEPFLSQAKANPAYRSVFSIFDVKPPDLTNVYFASQSYLNDNAKAARSFVQGIRASNKKAVDDPAAARTAVSTVTGAPAPAVANIQLPTWLPQKATAPRVNVVVQRMVKFDFITKAPPRSNLVWSGLK